MIRRLVGLALLCASLAACSSPRGLSFVQPSGGASVSGMIEVVLKATEPTPGIVELYGNDRWLGEVVQEEEQYRLSVNAGQFSAGKLILKAVPQTGLPVETAVTVTAGGDSVSMPGSNNPNRGDDPLNQGGLLGLLPGAAITPIGNAFRYMPPNFPWAKLYAPLLKAGVGQLLAPAQAAQPATLPRGVFSFDEIEQTWVFEDAQAGTLEITFNYLDPTQGEPHDVKLNLIWDQDGPTTTVQGLTGPLEVPTGAWFFFQDNEADIVNLELSLDWLQPEACDTPILIPETLKVAGWLLKPREAKFPEAQATSLSTQQTDDEEGDEEEPDDKFENTGVQLAFNIEDSVEGTRVASQFYTTAVTEQGAEVELGYIFDARGPLVFDSCNVVSFTPELLSVNLKSLVGPEGGDKRGSILSVTFLELVFDGLTVPRRALIDYGELTVVEQDGGRKTITEDAEVTFDTGRGFAVDGTAQLPSGASVPLQDYLKTLWETYRQRVTGTP